MILAIMSLWRANPKGQCVVITPLDSQLQTVTAQLCVLEKVLVANASPRLLETQRVI